METTLVKVQENQLVEIVKTSGLAIDEGEKIKQSFLPFIIELAEIQELGSKINFENPTEIDEQIARTLRLKVVKVRTGASDKKDELKRMDLLSAKLKQDSYNLVATSCKITEEVYNNVEKVREIAEKKRKAELKENRIAILSEFIENPEIYPLGEMSEADFDNLVNGLDLAKKAKIAAEKKAEEERIAKEKAEAERIERMKIENERLKKEAEEKEKVLQIERDKAAKVLADQKAKADADIKVIQDKARKEKAETERIAKIERDKQVGLLRIEKEKARLANEELYKKRVADAKIQFEKEQKDKAELKAKKQAEKAPDIEKLRLWINGLQLSEVNVKGEANAVKIEIDIKFNAFKTWALQKINNL